MNNHHIVITLDGPAGSGKSTIAKILATKYDLDYLDTGAMYRGITYLALSAGLDLSDATDIQKLIDLANNSDWEFQDNCRIIKLNGEDISNKIRMPEINAKVSYISEIALIREVLVQQQRQLAQSKNCILDGRDAGTVIFPFADLKVYLDADPAVRAKRRHEEQIIKGLTESYEDVLASVHKRDHIDKTRLIAPLTKAADAIEIDCTDLTIEDVVSEISKLIERLL